MAERQTAQLFVCTTCRKGEVPADDPWPGQVLYDRIAGLVAELGEDAQVRPVPVTCFANCSRGSTAMVAGDGKWSYLMADLDADQAEDLVVYATQYARSPTGFVGRNTRPPSLFKSILVRIPTHLVDQPAPDAPAEEEAP
jgi:predicted metal-binding protein